MDNPAKPEPSSGLRFGRRGKRFLIVAVLCLALVVVGAVVFIFIGTNEYEPLAQRLSDHSETELAKDYNENSHDDFLEMRDEYLKQTEGQRLNLKTTRLYNNAVENFFKADEAFWKKDVEPEGKALIKEMREIWLLYKEAQAKQIKTRRETFDENCSWWINRKYNGLQQDDDDGLYDGVKVFVADFVLEANRFDKVVGAARRPYMGYKRPI